MPIEVLEAPVSQEVSPQDNAKAREVFLKSGLGRDNLKKPLVYPS